MDPLLVTTELERLMSRKKKSAFQVEATSR